MNREPHSFRKKWGQNFLVDPNIIKKIYSVIKPKKNKLIAFSGNKIKHEVFEITRGIRYTITCWYKNKRK